MPAGVNAAAVNAAAVIAADTDTTERLSADDQATLREEQFRAAALARQARQGAGPRPVPGVCANCRAQCLPAAVFCDEDCRADHERRQQILQRQGRAR